MLNGASQSFRLGVLAICAALDAKQSAPLDGHARRIITLSEGKGIEAVQAVRSNLYRHDDAQQSIADEYVAQPDHFGRATVIYLRAPDLFSEAEQYFYAEHHRNYGIVEQIEGRMARSISQGTGLAPMLERRYGLNPAAGALR